MANELEIIQADIYDDVTVDDRGRPVATKPFTNVATGNVFTKYIVFEVKGDAGTYPVTVKINLPDGNVQLLGNRSVTIRTGRNAVIVSRIRLPRPTPGLHRISLVIADRTVGTLDMDVKKE